MTRVWRQKWITIMLAKQLIIDNRAKLDKLTARLIEEKTLLGDRVKRLFAVHKSRGECYGKVSFNEWHMCRD